MPKMEPLITTLIPTYQRQQSLGRAIQSVQQQSEDRIRIAVFDNASTDDTEYLVREIARYDKRVTYHRNDFNIGANANYEKAMASVTTPFFSLFADDDELKPNFYKVALNFLLANPQCGLCGGLTEVRKTDQTTRIWPINWQDGMYAREDAISLLTSEHITWTSILFDSTVLKTVGKLDPMSLWYSEHNYQFRVALQYPVAFISEVFATWNDDGHHDTRDNLSWLSGALHTAKMIGDLHSEDITAHHITNWVKRESHLLVKNEMRTTANQWRSICRILNILLRWNYSCGIQRLFRMKIRNQILKALIGYSTPYQFALTTIRGN